MIGPIGLQAITLRKFYESDNSRTQPNSRDLERQQELFEVLYDGKALGDASLETRNDDPFNLTFDQRYEEGLDVARVLLACGLHPAVVSSKDEPIPDKHVVFRDGSEQYCEVGRIVNEASARRVGLENYLKHGVYQQYASDASLRAAIANKTICVTLDKLPEAVADKKNCVNEIAEYFKRTKLLVVAGKVVRPFDDGCPTLNALGAAFTYTETSRFSAIFVNTPHIVADPAVALACFQDMVAKKQGKTYRGVSSIWLVLVIKDTEQAEANALAAIRPELKRTNLGQFSRIIVGYERDFASNP